MSRNTHKHHVIPRHMGGSDDPDNIIELTVEEHAEAHRLLYEEYGHWQDLLAWKGLTSLATTDECIRIAISEGGRKGAAITNAKRWNNTVSIRKYPKGTDGRKIRENRYWYNDGNKELQCSPSNIPEGYNKGRLNKSTLAARKSMSAKRNSMTVCK